MIENLDLKLSGQEPITRKELFKLVSSWGRKDSFYTSDGISVSFSKPKQCYPLENLDVSQIENLSFIFRDSTYNGDLFKWNVLNCINMSAMFWSSEFNNDSISNWNVSNVTNMDYMFFNSNFNSDISNWDVSNIINMMCMFDRSKFNNNSISNWNVFNVKRFDRMFQDSSFDKDISFWQFNENAKFYGVFNGNNNFKNKYNNENIIPSYSNDFIKWFEDNREKMRNINTTKEEVLGFFSFDSNLNKDIK